MYTVSHLKRAIENPFLAAREVNRLYHRRLYTRTYNRDGVDLFDADWDNLVVLDACRHDTFAELHDLPGTYDTRTSSASATKEWLQANVDGRDLTDTVYVTASPILYRNRDAIDAQFHRIANVWRDHGWDDRYKTVLPSTVAEYALQAANAHPDKRLLVHFIQPHFPFIGQTGREHFDLSKLNFRWVDVMSGEIDVDPELIRRAYRENLELALPHVEELLTELRGKTVVTSDHGQMFGERSTPLPMKEYGHPPGIYTEELVRVPWLSYRAGPRKEITRGEPSQVEDDLDEEVVTDRLKQLGYVS